MNHLEPELIAHAEAAPANVAPVAPVVAPVVPPAAPVNWLEVLQLRKLVQLVFFYFVFTYNRPYSDKKKLFIALTMLFVYLIQVGLFKWLFKRFCDQFNKVSTFLRHSHIYEPKAYLPLFIHDLIGGE